MFVDRALLFRLQIGLCCRDSRRLSFTASRRPSAFASYLAEMPQKCESTSLRVLLVIQYQQSGPHFLHILVFAGGIGCAVGIRCGGFNDSVRIIRDTALSVNTAGAINRTLALRSQRIVLFIAIWWVAHSASGAGTSTGACSVMPAEPFADPLLSATDESNKLPLIGACAAFLGVDLPSAAAQHVPCVRRAKGRPQRRLQTLSVMPHA
jgi:hypothetical protein